MAVSGCAQTYYLTDYYRKYPLVLVRLSHIDRDALRDVLSVSWRLTATKAGKRTVGKFKHRNKHEKQAQVRLKPDTTY